VDSEVWTGSQVDPLDRNDVAEIAGEIDEICLVCDDAGKVKRVRVGKADYVGSPMVLRAQCNFALEKSHRGGSRCISIEDSDEKSHDSNCDNSNDIPSVTMRL